ESPAVEEQTVLETFSNITPENKARYDAEKEAIHLILTGIGDDIYSTVDACKTAHEMFYKMMNEILRNQLEVATMQVNVQFLQQLQPEWSRFMTIVKKTVDLDKELYHKLFDILKQYQKEVNEIRAEKIARNANPLALVAVAQQYPDTIIKHQNLTNHMHQHQNNHLHPDTKYKGKEIVKPITPPSESASEEENWQFGNQRTITVAGARETVGSQLEKPVPLQAEHANWLCKTMVEEIDVQNWKHNYSYMQKIQEVPMHDSGMILRH
ncbi:hypothetical protein Tco_0695522, partial [Tanacetum coccineum]